MDVLPNYYPRNDAWALALSDSKESCTLEHGFEKTRNDFYSARSRTLARQESVWMGYDPTGRGSELVTERVHNFCSQTKRRKQPLERVPTGPACQQAQGLACWDRSGPLPIESHGRRARSRGGRGCEVWRRGRVS